jgi:hypothetical protein
VGLVRRSTLTFHDPTTTARIWRWYLEGPPSHWDSDLDVLWYFFLFPSLVVAPLAGTNTAQGYGLMAGLGAALAVGLIVGAINGFLVAYLQLPSLVVTLGALYIVRGVFNDYAFGRTITAAMVPPEIAWIGLNRLGSIPYLFIIGLSLAIVSGIVMRRVKAARDLYAIGSNPAAAELAGLDSLVQDDIVFLPESKDPFEQFVEELAGANLLLEAMVDAGLSREQLAELLAVRRMVASDDRIQARLPYFISIQ